MAAGFFLNKRYSPGACGTLICKYPYSADAPPARFLYVLISEKPKPAQEKNPRMQPQGRQPAAFARQEKAGKKRRTGLEFSAKPRAVINNRN
jgi:hypothetical protein